MKAYTTRVGAGPFPTELFDEMGEHIATVGAEFGATTGRPRRVGWFDAVALRRSIINSSVSGLCVTKLDVLDGLETIRICIGYEIDGDPVAGLPVVVDRFAECQPVYEDMPGWQASTVGIKSYSELPAAAQSYLARIWAARSKSSPSAPIGSRRSSSSTRSAEVSCDRVVRGSESHLPCG